ncbi:MAG TPA: glycosyltransferase family 4 protein [Bacteroidota bacterium]|nr:glycosyltransferase family 4 protein [Bacteroidota bacterium]
MKALICHNYYKTTSGEDLVIAEDIQILRSGGIDVKTFSRSNKEIDKFTMSDRVLFLKNTIYSRRSVKELEQVIGDERPDVAIVQNVFPLISPSVYYVFNRLNVPVVQLVYNYRLVCPNAILYTEGAVCERCVKGNFFPAVRHRCFRESYSLSAVYAATLAFHRHIGGLSRRISAYVTPDRFLGGKLVEGGFPSERIFPIFNPFDVTKYSPRMLEGEYFLYFGRIVREKGIFTLLKAMELLPNFRLVVVGGGSAEGEARQYVSIAGLRNVEFAGPQYGKDLEKIMDSACAVVVPTEWYDNSPLVVHQAFALGKPVIASRIDGIPEIVADGFEGMLFTPGDVRDLVEKMRSLGTDKDLCRRLGAAARRKAEEHFTVQKRFAELSKVMEFAQNNPVRV